MNNTINQMADKANDKSNCIHSVDNLRKYGDFDKVPVEIWGYQYKAFQRAASIINTLGGDTDSTPEHILREFEMSDDTQGIVDCYLSGVDMPENELKIMKKKWRDNQKDLLAS